MQGSITQFNAKVPGPTMSLGAVHTTLRYSDFFKEKPNVGYEPLIYDCMIGDATLFQRADNIEAGWTAVQPLLDLWSGDQGNVEGYAAGSAGPLGSHELLARGGHQWSPLGSA